ncbi:MAG: exosortase-associated EpsI family protein [Chlorobium sp.]|nr:MAG: exosortase-associated EpsI family protein [Chlorobium sp.]
MRLTKYFLLAILFSLVLISSEIFVEIRQHPFKGPKPDLQNIIKQHPQGWQPIPGSSVDPRTNSPYDLVASQIYKRTDGKAASIVMTWSYDGFHRAGHAQEVCYNSQGFTVSTPKNSSVILGGQKLDVVTFEGRYGDMTEDVIYWRVTGGIHDAALQENISMTQRFKEVPRILIGDIPNNLMVRVSTWRSATDPPSTVHIDYIKSYLQSVPPKTRHFLTGL